MTKNYISLLIESLPLPLIELPEIVSLDREPVKSSTSSSSEIQPIDGDVHQQSTFKEPSHPDISIECSSVPNIAISETLESPLEQLTSFSISNIISEIDRSFDSDESTTLKQDTATASSEKEGTNDSPLPDDAVLSSRTEKLTNEIGSPFNPTDDLSDQNMTNSSLVENTSEDTMENKADDKVADNDGACSTGAITSPSERSKDFPGDTSTPKRTNDDDFRQDLVDVEDMVNNVKGKEGTEKLTSKLQEKENDCNSISAMISEKVKVQNIFSSIVHSLYIWGIST